MTAAQPRVTVRIESVYADGHEAVETHNLPAPTGDMAAWWEFTVWPLTGDGHGAEHPRLGHCYTASVVAADDDALIGASQEWAG